MSASGPPSRRSVPPPASEKARNDRIQRLKRTLDVRLENPIAAIDALMLEAAEGAPHLDLWELLHAVALRDDMLPALSEAYIKASTGPRMRQLEPKAQAEVLMHAVEYFQDVLNDEDTAEVFLERILQIDPTEREAYARFESILERLLDGRRLLELYALVAHVPPKPLATLATQAFHRLLQLAPKDPLSDAACLALVALADTNPRLVDALESHCRATRRPALACAVLEQAIEDEIAGEEADEARIAQWRDRLIQLYAFEVGTPEAAIAHVEKLLEGEPAHPNAIKVAERLLSAREVASRAAAALQAARRARL